MSTSEKTRSRSRSLDEFVGAGALIATSAAVDAFVRDAAANSGLDPAAIDPNQARYSLILPEGTLDDLELDSTVTALGETSPLGELIGSQLRYDQASLARAIWALEGFENLRGFLQSLRVLVRYSRDDEQRLTARVLPVGATLGLIEKVERNEHLGIGSELVIDAVTRMLGIRRKVLLLDYNRRLNDGAARGNSLLGRTRSRLVT